MKSYSLGFERASFVFALVISAIFLLSQGTASAQNHDYFWNNAAGNTNGNWQDGSASTPWRNNGVADNQPWSNSAGNQAWFGGNNVVTAVGPISFNYIIPYGGGTTVIQGDDITKNSNGGLVVQTADNSSITIDSNLNMDVAANSDRWNFVNNGSGTITINGNITYFNSAAPTAPPVPYRTIIFNTNGVNGNFVVNGSVSDGAGVSAGMRLGEGSTDQSTLTVTGDLSNMSGGIGIAQGTLILGTSQSGPGTIGTYNGGSGISNIHTILTEGAQTITSPISLSNQNGSASGFVTLGASTANVSTFTNTVYLDTTYPHLVTPAGSRVNFNNFVGASEVGLLKMGAGTMTLSGASNYNLGGYGGTGTVAADIQQGTLLINNTTGSAFGGNTGTVQVEAGATLGGSGISTNRVVPVNATTSIIAPGDSGSDGGTASTGTLTLEGGLDTSNGGATINFKIDGANNDKLFFADADFIPTGVLTINLINMGSQDSILTGPNNLYTLIEPGSGNLDDSNLDSGATTIVAPWGYTATEVSFNDFTGFQVEFIAAPEPSTYALMLGGLGFLTFCLRRKSRA